jgi:uncharacterized protein YjbJ (UPF0337 family)
VNDNTASQGREVLDRVTGKVKETVGGITGNDALVEEGASQQDLADARREARGHDQEAAQATAEAELTAKRNALRDERARLLAEQRNEQAISQIERDEQAALARVDADRMAKQDRIEAERVAANQDADIDRLEATEEYMATTSTADAAAAEAEAARQRAESLLAAAEPDQEATKADLAYSETREEQR